MNITRTLTVNIEIDSEFGYRFVARPGGCTINIYSVGTDHGFEGREWVEEIDVITTHDPIFEIQQLEGAAVEWCESDDFIEL